MHGKIKRKPYLLSCNYYRLIDTFGGCIASPIKRFCIINIEIIFYQVEHKTTTDTFFPPLSQYL